MPLKPSTRLVAAVGASAAALVLTFVSTWEGIVPRVYRDPVGILTACMGHTGPELRMGQVFTPQQCADIGADDLVRHARAVQDCVDVPLSEGELAAYVSFAFNAGADAFCSSTLVRKLNADDHRGACAELTRWNRAGGRVVQGLTNRRAAERALCERDLA